MGYTTRFEGEIPFSRELTVSEFNALKRMNADPDECRKYTPKNELPDAYMQWVSNDDGTALVWDGAEKFYAYIHWLRWLIKYFFEPKGITLNGQLQWQGEEIGDVGYLYVNDNKVTTRKTKLKTVECPHCGERFVPSEE